MVTLGAERPPRCFCVTGNLESGMRLTAVVLGIGVILGGLNVLPSGARLGAAEMVAAKLGQKIADVTFTDAAGKKASLYDLKGKKAVVAVFISFECPVSTSYSPVLADLAKRYADKD